MTLLIILPRRCYRQEYPRRVLGSPSLSSFCPKQSNVKSLLGLSCASYPRARRFATKNGAVRQWQDLSCLCQGQSRGCIGQERQQQGIVAALTSSCRVATSGQSWMCRDLQVPSCCFSERASILPLPKYPASEPQITDLRTHRAKAEEGTRWMREQAEELTQALLASRGLCPPSLLLE